MKTAIALVLSVMIFGGGVYAQPPVEIWFGNVDGSPIVAPIGTEILVPVYVQTAPDVNMIYATILLGTDNAYISGRLGGNLYAPLTQWTTEFYGPFPDSPNPGNTTEECTGLDHLYNAPLHFETPTLIMEFRMTVPYDESLIGQTVPALLPGFNPDAFVPEEQTTFFVRDDIATMDYPIQHFSQITFVSGPQIPTLSQWGLIIFGLLLMSLLTTAMIRVRRKYKAKMAMFTVIFFALAVIPFHPNSASGEQGANSPPSEQLVPCSSYSYTMGDYNGSSTFNVFDMIFAYYWLAFPGLFVPPYLYCECCAPGVYLYVTLDVNGSCAFNVIDLAAMSSRLRTSLPAFVPPACI